MAEDKPQTDEQKLAGYWIDQLNISEKWQRNWVSRSKRIIRRYKNAVGDDLTGVDSSDNVLLNDAGNRRFAILWSNIETLKPAVYGRTPTPVVSRRYRDPDPVGKYASELLERALKFGIDAYDFDDRMQLSRDDYLLLARGQVWVRYIPHVNKAVGAPQDEEAAEAEEGQITNNREADGAAEEVLYQEVVCDHVAYNDWGMQPCRNWAETGYVWRRAYLTRPELIERFGPRLGRAIPLDWKPQGDENRRSETNDPHKACVYEIWDKPTGKVFWVSKGYPDGVLDERPDPLGLKNFFPCPRPLMGTTPQDAYLPIADFIYYQDQADELDELTQRIGRLTDALRMVGVYAEEYGMELSNVFSGNQNTLIPVKAFSTLQDKGGLKGVIEWLPIDMVMTTLQGCFETRKQILNDIYQITGLSDIIRGESDPSETATAQRLKGQWGSLRVRDRQKEMARFARDVLDMKGEIIAAKFTVDTLKAMTDVKLLTAQEKAFIQQQQALYQQAVASSQQSGMPPPPQPQIDPQALELMSRPTWDDVMALMRDKARLLFRIDIETNSTIEPDESEAKASFSEWVSASSQLMQVASTIIPGAPQTAPLFAEFFKEGARVFNVSTTMEDVVERVFGELAQMPPAPPEGQAPTGPTQEELQLQAQEQQSAQALESQGQQIEVMRLQQEAQYDAADLQLRANEQRLKAEALRRDPTPQGTA